MKKKDKQLLCWEICFKPSFVYFNFAIFALAGCCFVIFGAKILFKTPEEIIEQYGDYVALLASMVLVSVFWTNTLVFGFMSIIGIDSFIKKKIESEKKSVSDSNSV
ncbi:MAG: hypothetical protein ABFD91_14500 [Anaerohalosphaeraceae bacterium]